MFEGKPPKPQDCAVSDLAPAGDELRELSWSDLRSRLDLARDLREELHIDDVNRLTSFDAHSARHIAARTDSKDPVNPDDLGHGKGLSPMSDATGTNGIGRDPQD